MRIPFHKKCYIENSISARSSSFTPYEFLPLLIFRFDIQFSFILSKEVRGIKIKCRIASTESSIFNRILFEKYLLYIITDEVLDVYVKLYSIQLQYVGMYIKCNYSNVWHYLWFLPENIINYLRINSLCGRYFLSCGWVKTMEWYD